MKLETLIKKIADRAEYPELVDYLQGKIPLEDLPTDCLPWQGTMSSYQKGPRMHRKIYPDGSQNFWLSKSDKPIATMRYQGKRIMVPRQMFIIRNHPDFDFRMRQICDTHGCANPRHWKMKMVGYEPPAESSSEVPEIQDDEWSMADVEELVEILLTEQEPRCWKDVCSTPLMEGVPEALLREALIGAGKEYLT